MLSKILQKGDPYPCTQTKVYTTSQNNQQKISINVYEAGSDMEDVEDISEHDFYGGFVLDGIAPAPKGEPSIDVSFSYDKSRCLTVEATDRASGLSKQIEIRKGEKLDMKPEKAPVDFALLIDTSGSMRYDNGLEDAILASRSLFDEMLDFNVHRLSLISFGDNPTLQSHLTQDRTALKATLDDISPYGGTNMIRALEMAYDELHSSINERVIIMVTDGYPNTITGTLSYAEKVKADGLRIVAIGAGSDIKFDFLRDLASEGDAYKLSNMSELKKTFKEVISKITEK